MWKRTYKRDLGEDNTDSSVKHMSKETYRCERRLMKLKETYTCEKRLIKETYRCEKRLTKET